MASLNEETLSYLSLIHRIEISTDIVQVPVCEITEQRAVTF